MCSFVASIPLKRPWTSVAEPYPRGFCSLLAAGVCEAVGWSKSATVASCARCSHARIGEAKNPGPAVPRRARNFSLEQARVQTFASLQLGDRRWDLFLDWCCNFISGDVVGLFLKVPLLLAHSIIEDTETLTFALVVLFFTTDTSFSLPYGRFLCSSLMLV